MTKATAQRAVGNALVAILGAHAAIVAITGRASKNILPVDQDDEPAAIGLAYDVGPTSERDTIGEHYDVEFTVFAEAPERDVCLSLLDAVETALTRAAFVAAGADAMVEQSAPTAIIRGESAHDDDPKRTRDVYAGAIEGTIWFTPPAA